MAKATAKKIRGRKKGKLILVGAGPGDPELITVKGARFLNTADVVVYDYLAAPALLRLAPAQAEKIYVGKKAGAHTMKQEEINHLLAELVSAGKQVVRLKGGDPFVFGRGGEEILGLERGSDFEVVPGVTAGIAAPAFAGIPVTHRGSAVSVAFITGHEDPGKEVSSVNWEHLARGVDTLVFYMGVGNLPQITAALMAAGRSPATPAAVIQWGTTARQRSVTGTLENIAGIVAQKKITAPAITVVGKVAALAPRLRWYEDRPLFGRKIIITRTREQSSLLSMSLGEQGAAVTELPTIAINSLTDTPAVRNAIRNFDRYDWIVFTSPNSVRSFLDAVIEQHGDIRALGSARIASIGPGTSETIRSFHLRPAITATEAVAEGLVAGLWGADDWKGKRVLIPRAERARDLLPQTLKGWGARPQILSVYRTVKPPVIDKATVHEIVAGTYDLITFTSSSTFQNFVGLVGAANWQKIRRTLKSASIGPVTSASMRALGIEPTIEASEHTITGLAKTIGEYCSHDRHI